MSFTIWHAALSFLLGNLCATLIKHLPYLGNILVLMGLATCLLFIAPITVRIVARKSKHGKLIVITQCLATACLGFAWPLLFAWPILDKQLPTTLIGKDITVQGQIVSIPQVTVTEQQAQTRFQFYIPTLKQRVLLNWYQAPATLQVGDNWQLHLRLKPARGFMNPGGFDYERWLLQHALQTKGYVRNSQANQLLVSPWYQQPLARVREYMQTRLSQAANQARFLGLIQALVIGERSAMTTSQWHVLQATGTTHLMSISGLHIGLVASAVFFLMALLWRRSEYLLLRLPAQRAALMAACIAALFYSALAGFALPTQRALIMLAVFTWAALRYRHTSLWQGWATSLLLVLIVDPFASLASGFWLSFAAVAVLIYGLSGRIHTSPWWQRWGRAQWVVTIGLFPLTLLFFQRSSLVALVANIIAIPWVGFVVVPLSLLAGIASLLPLSLQCLTHALLSLANIGLAVVWPVLQYMSQLPGAQWHMALVSPWQFAVVAIGVVWLLAPRGFPHRSLAVICFLPLVYMQVPRPPYGQAWLSVLDVGQGLASVVVTQHHVLVYDAGPRYSARFDTGDAVVAPYLRHLGIKRINTLMISHGDNDHIGGAFSLLQQFPVTNILTSVPERFTGLQAQTCRAGQHWQWDGVKFVVLFPPATWQRSGNDSSCVLRVVIGHQSLLLPGDIEKKSEHYLLTHQAAALASGVVVVPHHGSKTSSTPRFVYAVHPKYALFSFGYRNRYGLPKSEIVAHYRALGARVLFSPACGAMLFKLNGTSQALQPICYRQLAGHYWNYPA